MSYFKKKDKASKKRYKSLLKEVFPSGIKLTNHALIRFFERKRRIKFKQEEDFFKLTAKAERKAVAEIIMQKIKICLESGKVRKRVYCGESHSLYLGLRMVAIVRGSKVVTIYHLRG